MIRFTRSCSGSCPTATPPGHLGRQRCGHRRADRTARPRRPRRDRGGRPAGGEDRDRRRAPLRRAFRRSDGDPTRHRSLRTAARRRHPATPAGGGGERGRGRRRRSDLPVEHLKGAFHDRDNRRPPSVGRAARQAGGQSPTPQVPYMTRALTPFEVLSEERLGLIEENADMSSSRSDRLPRQPEALAAVRGCGGRRRGERVRFPRGLARRIVQATRPVTFTQVARNPRTTSISAARTRCSPPPTARRSSATSTTGGATARSRTSATSSSSPYMSPYLHHSGGTSASPSTSLSTSGTTTWSTRTCAIPTSRSWAR